MGLCFSLCMRLIVIQRCSPMKQWRSQASLWPSRYGSLISAQRHSPIRWWRNHYLRQQERWAWKSSLTSRKRNRKLNRMRQAIVKQRQRKDKPLRRKERETYRDFEAEQSHPLRRTHMRRNRLSGNVVAVCWGYASGPRSTESCSSRILGQNCFHTLLSLSFRADLPWRFSLIVNRIVTECSIPKFESNFFKVTKKPHSIFISEARQRGATFDAEIRLPLYSSTGENW